MTDSHTYHMKYGDSRVGFKVPKDNVLAVIKPRPLAAVPDETAEIERALNNPIGAPRLRELATPRSKAVLVVSDITRPCPSHLIVPPVIGELLSAGIKKQNIAIVFATGTHRQHTEDERVRLLGKDIVQRFKCIDHDCQDSSFLQYVGVTTSGTPCYLNKAVLAADIKIGIANIEPHVFAGYSGGGKSIFPGVADKESIMRNHQKIYSHAASTRAGILDNPIRKEMDEVALMAGLNYIVNVVLDDRRRIVKAVAGEPAQAFQEGVRICDKMYKTTLQERAAIVVAAAGGYPKDINLYQAQKALASAREAVKDGGTVILMAECREGIGSEALQHFLLGAKNWTEVIHRAKGEQSYHPFGFRGYDVGDINVICVSAIASDLLKRTPLTPADSLDQALEMAFSRQGAAASIILMPYASSTLVATDDRKTQV